MPSSHAYEAYPTLKARSMERKRSSLISFTLLTIIFVFLAIFLFSFKQYPLNDDWSYLRAAEVFHNTGQIRFTDWTAMSLIFQLWWGTTITRLFGYSIELLRLSTLLISLIGLIFFYLLVREFGLKWYMSILVIFLLLFNPFSFPLLFTFFTDHHFISLLVVSIFLYYKAFKNDRDTYLLLGSLVSSCAILVRQNGILIPISVIICLMLSQRSLKTFLRKAAIASILPLFTMISFTYWLSIIHGTPSELVRQTTALVNRITSPQLFLKGIVSRAILILEFAGFSLIPLSFSFPLRVKNIITSRYRIAVFLCSAAGVVYLLFTIFGFRTTPYLLLKGFPYAFASEYGVREVPGYLHVLAAVGTALSVISLLYLFYLMFNVAPSMRKSLSLQSPALVIYVIGVTQLLFLFVTPYKITRYYLIVLPFFILLVIAVGRYMKISQTRFVLFLIPYLLSSFAITQDFMHWNQTKWECADELLRRGIAAPEISAGFAWDCWHNWTYGREHAFKVEDEEGEIPWWVKNLVPVVKPRYIVSNSPRPTRNDGRMYYGRDEWHTIRVAQYYSVYYARKMSVFVLEKE
jgi:hypothetical protein